MAQRRAAVRLVIFDCDGVLVDSEPTANRILAEDLTARGWAMTTAQATRRFLGISLADTSPVVEARLGIVLPPDWQDALQTRIAAAMAREAVAIAGAVAAVAAISAMGVAWRVASNSSHAELAAKFARIGLADAVAGRVHSFTDVAHGKPAPDLFLATAAAEGVAARDCVVVEDSIPGVRAAIAAGMDCLGFVPDGEGEALRAAGAVVFHSMEKLPALIAIARQVAA